MIKNILTTGDSAVNLVSTNEIPLSLISLFGVIYKNLRKIHPPSATGMFLQAADLL